jgi:hypothetical protein
VDVHRETIDAQTGRVEYSARRASATIFLFKIGSRCGNRADYGGAHENLNENLYSSCPLLLSVALIVADTGRAGKSIHRQIQSSNGRQGHSHSESFLYTQGSDPAALELYKMMQSGEAGEKISRIELVNLTREDVKKATTPMDGPTGKVCLNLKRTKKLVTKG